MKDGSEGEGIMIMHASELPMTTVSRTAASPLALTVDTLLEPEVLTLALAAVLSFAGAFMFPEPIAALLYIF